MNAPIYLTIFSCIAFGIGQLAAQTVIRGKVIDDTTGDPVIGAIVEVQGTAHGVVTDFNGEYYFKLDSALPVSLTISYTGYKTVTIEITNASVVITTRLTEKVIELESAEVVGNRIPDKHKKSALVVESLDLEGIKETPNLNFYDGLAKLKDVDISGSLGYKIINTRGFYSTTPVRSLQVIDGVDNQAPGLNFSLGNFLGVSELDVLRVDIVVGANGAYYGPNAFNGVISMETKSPFFHKGLSVILKAGERNLFEGSLRFADVVKNKKGHDLLGYKLNFAALRADDWTAENDDPITASEVPASNPGRYDAVNIYGDEYYATNDFSGEGNLYQNPGLGIFYRIGYKEVDLVENETENYKANLAFHLRTLPSKTFDSPELILSSNFGSGTTVYQGDNRFSLKDILFFQHRLEFRQKDNYFIRAYYTHEDAGQSYDPYFTALRLQELSKTDQQWGTDYRSHWKENYVDRMCSLGYPKVMVDPDSITFDQAAAELWLITYADSLAKWHASTAEYANLKNIRNPPTVQDFLVPGSDTFNAAFNDITSRYNNEEGGTRFFDQSALFHTQGEYAFEAPARFDVRIGANYRLYMPDSKGTIFSDTAGTRITNAEIGIYGGFEKKLFEDKLTTSATLRVDKNQNFKWIQTPAASLVYAANDKTFFRVSFSSAIRNPTLSDQYLYLNVGPAILAGHIQGVDSLITVESFKDYLDYLDPMRLVYFDIDDILPEKVRTIEGGIRTTLFNTLYADLGYYRSTYTDFLGYLIGITANIDKNSPLPFPKDVQVYRYSANSKNTVTSQGFSIGLNYYWSRKISLSGNYSFNQLRKTVEDDPIIPAYNTPEHKFNLGIAGRDIPIGHSGVLRNTGFSINYKWVQGFQFEGSPQFTGYVPTYGIVDAQVSAHQEKIKTTFKVGVSNLFNNEHYETYGGPKIGRLAYVSIAYNF